MRTWQTARSANVGWWPAAPAQLANAVSVAPRSQCGGPRATTTALKQDPMDMRPMTTQTGWPTFPFSEQPLRVWLSSASMQLTSGGSAAGKITVPLKLVREVVRGPRHAVDAHCPLEWVESNGGFAAVEHPRAWRAPLKIAATAASNSRVRIIGGPQNASTWPVAKQAPAPSPASLLAGAPSLGGRRWTRPSPSLLSRRTSAGWP